MNEQKEILVAQKSRIILLIIAISFVLLIARLFYLQVISDEFFANQAERNRLRVIEVSAKRGEILDRNGVVLATNIPVYKISIGYLSDKKELEKTITSLAEVLKKYGVSEKNIRERLAANGRDYEATEILELPWGLESVEVVSQLSERRNQLPGVIIDLKQVRYYPQGALAGHILGHVGYINEDEVKKYDTKYYSLNDKVGKSGIEKMFENIEINGERTGLLGTKGVQQVEVDTYNRPVNEAGFSIPPIAGDNVVLTIDSELQLVMEDAMDTIIADSYKDNNKAGIAASVAIDVKTGEILAMASKPDFNPNDFVDGLSKKEADYYYNNDMRPEINKAVSSAYPPGSTFKMLTGMAALEYGKLSPSYSLVCKGAYWKKPYIKCWGVHGTVSFYRGLAVSCNTYFQYAAEVAGIENISKTAKEFGLGVDTGMKDLPSVDTGFLPNPDSKYALQEDYYNMRIERYTNTYKEALDEINNKKGLSETEKEKLVKDAEDKRDASIRWAEDNFRFERNWQAYDTYNTGIGQGMNNYTMLQLANYVATIANGGTRYRPHLVKEILSNDGKVLSEIKAEALNKVGISDKVLQQTRDAMKAVASPGGAAYYIFSDFPIQVACKTGTAQTGRTGDDKQTEFHGVFVAFAPYDDPKIAFAGLVEYGNHGSSSAGLIAKAVFAKYFGIDEFTKIDPGFYLESPLSE